MFKRLTEKHLEQFAERLKQADKNWPELVRQVSTVFVNEDDTDIPAAITKVATETNTDRELLEEVWHAAAVGVGPGWKK